VTVGRLEASLGHSAVNLSDAVPLIATLLSLPIWRCRTNLSPAVAFMARVSDAVLRAHAHDAARIGFNGPNSDDVAKALAMLKRWQKMLKA
jgi:hypothetical protein